jgi:hypothetical protein
MFAGARSKEKFPAYIPRVNVDEIPAYPPLKKLKILNSGT